MKLDLYAIYDRKAVEYRSLYSVKRKEEALRIFSSECNNPESDFHKYAEDYALYQLGEWDTTEGKLIPYDTPLLIINGTTASVQHYEHYANLVKVQVA